MTLTDTWLLAKKIALGVVVTVVPLAIIAGGLWATQRFGTSHARTDQISSTKGASHAN
jgi:hypothetical protein